MLKKPYRLKSPSLFRATLNAQRICVNRCFIAFGLKRKAQPAQFESKGGATNTSLKQISQFGIIVSKKVHKRAAKRNRLKRQLREIIRTVLLPLQAEHERRLSNGSGSETASLPSNPELSYRTLVFVVRASALNVSYQEFKQHVLSCFKLNSSQGTVKTLKKEDILVYEKD